MKLLIEKNVCRVKRGGVKEEEKTQYLLEDIENQNNSSWIDFGEVIGNGDIKWKGATPRKTNFYFKAKGINKNSVELEVKGESVIPSKKCGKGYETQKITLKANESKTFSIKTKTCVIDYTISIAKEKKSTLERMSLRQFMKLIRYNLKEERELEKSEVSIYGPILYEMEEKYYKACVNYLQNNVITLLRVGNVKIEEVLGGCWVDEKKCLQKIYRSVNYIK